MSDVIVDRICMAYTPENARRDGIYYWPDPLPTPDPHLSPDPLVLFQPEETTSQLALVPLSLPEVLSRRSYEKQKPSMQIPLGLIDKPELQQRDTCLIDLHGTSGALTGGPLLLVGAQNSGKATALQTILLWLTARYLPAQFKCIVIDPTHELSLFRSLPHFYDNDGNSLWTSGTTDEELQRTAQRVSQILGQRQKMLPQQHWHDDTLARLWLTGNDIPLLLLVVSQYHRFTDRLQAQQTLKKMMFSIAESRFLGVYLVITSTEVSIRHLSTDIMSKIGTRISLFLSEQQRADFFSGRIYPMDSIPGRGLLITPEHQINQVQLALPMHGNSEHERYEQLKNVMQLLQ
jgi:hypothetical protein